MNKLWVHLSLAFSAILILGVVAILSAPILSGSPNWVRDVTRDNMKRPGGVVDRLTVYYRENQTWEGAGDILFYREAAFDPGRREPPVQLIFADETGAILYNGTPEQDLTTLADDQIKDAIPILVDGVPRAYLRLHFNDVDARDVLQADLVRRTIEMIVQVSIVGSVVGIAFGVLFSRWLTAPLRRLSASARAIRDGKREQRIRVTGTQEIRDVALAFNEMSEALDHHESLRRNLLADVAHELRTPLTVMQSNLYAMLDDMYPSDKEHIALLYDQSRVLNRLVSDLHELAQAEAGQLVLNRKPTHVEHLVRDVVALFEPAAEEKSIAIETTVDAGVPEIDIDRERIHQVLYNLITNALRHTPEKGRVLIELRWTDRNLHLNISDSGEGIEPSHLEHIFDRFYRVDSGRSRNKGGTGLGLAIARALVEAHGGIIQAASDGVEGKGVTFAIRLPVTQ
jgi:signal transduction histidine kinase